MRFFLSAFFVLMLSSLSAQNDCNNYFPFKNGAVLEYQTLDKKGKLESTMRQEVKSIQERDGSVTAVLGYQLKDKKGKEVFTGETKMECDGEAILLDISGMMPATMKSMSTNAEMELEGDGFRIPNNLKAGDQLPDSKNNVKIAMSGINMNVPIEMSNIKVEAEEEITTPAGTFKALKMSYDSYTKAMMMKVEGKVVNWFAKGIGNIKTETYDKNGKLVSVQELTKFEK